MSILLWLQIFRRWIEEELFQRCDPRTAWKLLKDLRASIIRKASRGLPRMKMLTRCARTTARATCTGMIAEVCVGEVILSFRWWRARKKRAVAVRAGGYPGL